MSASFFGFETSAAQKAVYEIRGNKTCRAIAFFAEEDDTPMSQLVRAVVDILTYGYLVCDHYDDVQNNLICIQMDGRKAVVSIFTHDNQCIVADLMSEQRLKRCLGSIDKDMFLPVIRSDTGVRGRVLVLADSAAKAFAAAANIDQVEFGR